MTDSDDRILRWMESHTTHITPKLLSFELDLSYQTCKNRLKALEEQGLVTTPESAPSGVSTRGVYMLTELGHRYVTGEATVQELRDAAENSD